MCAAFGSMADGVKLLFQAGEGKWEDTEQVTSYSSSSTPCLSQYSRISKKLQTANVTNGVMNWAANVNSARSSPIPIPITNAPNRIRTMRASFDLRTADFPTRANNTFSPNHSPSSSRLPNRPPMITSDKSLSSAVRAHREALLRVDQGGAVVAGEAGHAPGLAVLLHAVHHPLGAQVAERVHTQVGADLVHRPVRGDQLLARGHVDAVEAGPAYRRRRQAEVHLAGAGFAQHGHQRARGGAAHQRVVHHHHALPLQHLAHGAELEAHLEVPPRLRGGDEGAADVVVADQPQLEGDPRRLGVAHRRRVRAVGDGDDDVGAALHRPLLRQPPPEGAPRAVHRAPPQVRVRPGEVHQLEDAWLRLGHVRP